MKNSSFLIAGKHAVIEALKNPKRRVRRVFLTEESKKKLYRESQKRPQTQKHLKDKKRFRQIVQ